MGCQCGEVFETNRRTIRNNQGGTDMIFTKSTDARRIAETTELLDSTVEYLTVLVDTLDCFFDDIQSIARRVEYIEEHISMLVKEDVGEAS